MFSNKSLVAVDIGSSAIKMLELSGNDLNWKLKNFAMSVLPKGAIENGVIADQAAVNSVLKGLVQKIGAKNRHASVSISGNSVILKRVHLTVGKDATVDEQMTFQAQQAFQVDPAELYYDYVEMGEQAANSTDVDILLSGARREVIEQYVQVVKDAGLQIAVMEAAPLSIANMFELNYGLVEGLIALISIGASHTQVSFIHQGRFLYSHDFPTGGEAYTTSISQLLSVDRESAEALKVSASATPSAIPLELKRAIDETTTTLANDIRQILGLFSSSADIGGAGPLKFAFLTGGACRTAGLDAAIAATLGIPVYFMNPFQRVHVNEGKFNLDQLMTLAPFMGVAIGLGVRQKGDKVAAA